jgi:hypothetical protein
MIASPPTPSRVVAKIRLYKSILTIKLFKILNQFNKNFKTNSRNKKMSRVQASVEEESVICISSPSSSDDSLLDVICLSMLGRSGDHDMTFIDASDFDEEEDCQIISSPSSASSPATLDWSLDSLQFEDQFNKSIEPQSPDFGLEYIPHDRLHSSAFLSDLNRSGVQSFEISPNRNISQQTFSLRNMSSTIRSISKQVYTVTSSLLMQDSPSPSNQTYTVLSSDSDESQTSSELSRPTKRRRLD